MLAYHKVNNINAKVGIYLRISLEDGDKIESNSIDNQRKLIYEYLYKTSTEYNCDISGFGKYAKSKFLTKKDWENYSWNKNYKNSFFKVNINCSIISSNLLLET